MIEKAPMRAQARSNGSRDTVVQRSSWIVLIVALATGLSACATPAPLLTGEVTSLRTGISAAHQQAEESFTSANELAREQAIERKAASPETILRPEDFPVPVPATAVAQWDSAFGILDQYAAALQSLVDDKNSEQIGNSIGALGQALSNSTVLQSKIPASLTGVFSTLGQVLVQAAAERKATEVMRTTDPAFQAVINQMAVSIGSPTEAGSMANDVDSQWNNSVLPLLENEYRLIAPADQDQRRKVLVAYTQAMTSRDKQLDDLAQLRRSLLALGQAHHDAAEGKAGDALFWIGRINQWTDEIHRRMPAAGGSDK